MKDFEFVGQTMNEDRIRSMSKGAYKKKSRSLSWPLRFNISNEKSKHSKLDCVNYSSFKIRPYLVHKEFNTEEKPSVFTEIQMLQCNFF